MRIIGNNVKIGVFNKIQRLFSVNFVDSKNTM